MRRIRRVLKRIDHAAMSNGAWWARPYLRARFATTGNTFENFGAGNRLICDSARVEKSLITIMGSNNRIEFAAGAMISDTRLTIVGSNCSVFIGPRATMAGDYIWLTEDNSELRVGRDTIVRESQVVMTERNCRIHIGDECMIAFGSDVRCGDGHAIYDTETGEVLNRAHEIVIENHVWVTSESKILKDVHIGEGSIVGSRSVVTHHVPAHCMVAGSPAKVIRENVTWHRQAIDRLPEDWFAAKPPVAC